MVKTLYLIRHGETEGSEERRYKGTIDVPLSERGMRQAEKVSAFITKRLNQSIMHDAGYRMQDKKNHTPGIRDYESLSVAPKLNAIYCSDLSRAIRSAEIIAEPFGLSPVKIMELRERNFGVWEGMSFDEIKEKYPEDFNAWVRNPLRFSPTEGESTLEVKERVMNALGKIIRDNRLKVIQDAECNPPQSPLTKGGIKGGYHESCILHREFSNIAIVAHGGVNRIILCEFLGIPLKNIFRIEQDYGAVNVIEFYDWYPVVKLINYAV